MRIKEVEKCTGVTSKNIRFYEKEGLLSPGRNTQNGYREYSSGDIEALKKIKLLRKLGVSIEDIRLMQSGKTALAGVLSDKVGKFEKEINNINEEKKLCLKMTKQNILFSELDADSWLSEMRGLETNGVEFVNTDCDKAVKFLPEKYKTQYYESIIKEGQIDNTLLRDIVEYLEEIYKKRVDTEELLSDTLKRISSEERSKLLSLLKENDLELYSKLANNIYDFEDIINLDTKVAKSILEQFGMQTIVKASMGASPEVNEHLQSLFPDVDFIKERHDIGRIPVNEVMEIHYEIIKALNNFIQPLYCRL